MQLDIVTPEEQLYNGEVESVQLPGIDGSFQILNNHAALVAALGEGNINIKAKEDQSYAIEGGFVEVSDNKVNVLIEASPE